MLHGQAVASFPFSVFCGKGFVRHKVNSGLTWGLVLAGVEVGGHGRIIQPPRAMRSVSKADKPRFLKRACAFLMS